MKKIYQDNGLPFFDESWIHSRDYIVKYISVELAAMLRQINAAWDVRRTESPMLIPKELVSKEYGAEDIYITQDFYLRPETTAASYAYAANLIEHHAAKPPLCVWQATKSFRRENDQVSANVRLKEFYQMEFQCIVTEDTKADYQELLQVDLLKTVCGILQKSGRVVPSDRLPKYSEKTLDIELHINGKWLEVCSISRRTDVPFEWNGKKLINYEFAFGLDRLVYCFLGA